MSYIPTLLLATVLCGLRVSGQPGQLDPSFGVEGMAFLAVDTGLTLMNSDMVVQSDGRIVLTGRCYDDQGWDLYVIRCLPNGELDPTFADQGFLRSDLGSFFDIGGAVTVQPDGKILVAAKSEAIIGEPKVSLFRYLPDGTLDDTFGQGGVAATPSSSSAYPYDIGLREDGRVVIVGSSNGYDHIVVYQFTAAGAMDDTFQPDGTLSISPFPGTNMAVNVLVQDDGGLLLGCSLQPSGELGSALIRLLADGSYDPGFGDEGIVDLQLGSGETTIGGLGVQSDGRIIIAGAGNDLDDMFITRIGSDGTPDPTFATEGVAWISLSEGSDRVADLVIQADDAILLAGKSTEGAGQDAVAVLRLLPDGQLDPTFAGDGVATTAIPGVDWTEAYNIALQPDGRVVVDAYGVQNPVLLGYLSGLFLGTSERIGRELVFTAMPNPARDRVMITFELDAPGAVTLDLLDAHGRAVAPRADHRSLHAGTHRIELSIGQLAPGLYTIVSTMAGTSRTAKLLKE